MAIEKMMLMNLVGSLEDEHDILEALVLCESVQLSLEHNDLYDNNYIVHQYETMMGNDYVPILENYVAIGAHLDKTESKLKALAQGMQLQPVIDKVNFKKQYTIEDVETDIEGLHSAIGTQIDIIHQKRNIIEELLAFRRKAVCIRDTNFDITKLGDLRYFHYQIGLLSKDNNMQIKRNYENISAIVLRIGSVEDYQEDIYLVVYPMQFEEETSRLLKSLNWIELKIPEEVLGSGQQFIEVLDQKVEELKNEIMQLEHVVMADKESKQLLINRMYTRIKMEQKILEIKQDIMHGTNLFVLNAWIRKKEKKKVQEYIANITDKFVIITKNIEELDKKMIPPTQLKNNWLFSPFEAIVRMYGLPSYYEIDPTPFLALTFILMFGIMFGDIGQGAVYFLAGVLLQKKSKTASGVLTRLGLSSITFGFVYGSLFGLEQHQLPWLPSLTGPVLTTENIMRILIVGVVFGVVVLSVSFIIGIINALRRGDIEEGLFGKNGIVGYIFFMSFILTIVVIVGILPIPIILPILLMLLMLVVMIFKEPLANMMRKQKPYIHGAVGSYFTESIFEGVETILSTLSNSISFIRVGAFALNHAGLFMAFLVMSEMTTNIALKAVIIIIGNVLILTLEGLVVFIQGLRLQYYEMFSKYFKGDGIDYAPVKITNK